MTERSPMRVVKLGGSLLTQPDLRAALDGLCQRVSAREVPPTVLVCGGGLFADAVRVAQTSTGFSNDAAHDMAILAMAQCAWVLKSMCPDLVLADGPIDLHEAALAGRVALWAPLASPPTEKGWHVTSDSLAVWMAQTVEADELLLVKSCGLATSLSWQMPAVLNDAGQRRERAEAWRAAGVVDDAFPALVSGYAGAVQVCDLAALSQSRRLDGGAADSPALKRTARR